MDLTIIPTSTPNNSWAGERVPCTKEDEAWQRGCSEHGGLLASQLMLCQQTGPCLARLLFSLLGLEREVGALENQPCEGVGGRTRELWLQHKQPTA